MRSALGKAYTWPLRFRTDSICQMTKIPGNGLEAINNHLPDGSEPTQEIVSALTKTQLRTQEKKEVRKEASISICENNVSVGAGCGAASATLCGPSLRYDGVGPMAGASPWLPICSSV